LLAKAVPIIQQQHVRVAQLRALDRGRALAQRIAGRSGQQEGVTGHDLVLHVAELRLQREQRGIQLARGQRLHQRLRLVLGPDRGELGEGRSQRRCDLRQQVRRDRGDHPQAQRAVQRIAGTARCRVQIIGIQQQAPGALHHLLARGSGQDAPPVTLEQAYPEHLLELREL
jgi:hypothetical protein